MEEQVFSTFLTNLHQEEASKIYKRQATLYICILSIRLNCAETARLFVSPVLPVSTAIELFFLFCIYFWSCVLILYCCPVLEANKEYLLLLIINNIINIIDNINNKTKIKESKKGPETSGRESL